MRWFGESLRHYLHANRLEGAYMNRHLYSAEAERRQLIYDTLKPIHSELENLEARIEDLETRKEEIEKTLADPDFFSDKNKSVPLLNEYNEAREELDDLLLKWEQRQGDLESEKRKLGVIEE